MATLPRTQTARWTARLIVPAVAAISLVSVLPAVPGHAVTGAHQTRSISAHHKRQVSAGSHHHRRRGWPLGTLMHPRDVRPKPDFFDYCGSHSPNDPHCIALELAAIRHARKVQHFHVRPLVLPRNYRRLTFAEQSFVLTDLERVDRGLRPFSAMTATMSRQAAIGARQDSDPTLDGYLMRLLGIYQWRSVWADNLGPLATDYAWMYQDGYTKYGSPVTDCHHVNDTGCWGHRDAILGSYPGRTLIAGAAAARSDAQSIAQVLGGTNQVHLTATFRWRSARAHGAK